MSWRADFPALHQTVNGHPLAYLDSAATTQRPAAVLAALLDYYRHDNANPGATLHSLARRAYEQYEGARRTLAQGMPVVSEFWPYGLRRAGFDRDSFTDLVASIFTHMVHVDLTSNRWQRQPIGAIADLFAPYAGPEDNQEVILLSQARSVARA